MCATITHELREGLNANRPVTGTVFHKSIKKSAREAVEKLPMIAQLKESQMVVKRINDDDLVGCTISGASYVPPDSPAIENQWWCVRGDSDFTGGDKEVEDARPFEHA